MLADPDARHASSHAVFSRSPFLPPSLVYAPMFRDTALLSAFSTSPFHHRSRAKPVVEIHTDIRRLSPPVTLALDVNIFHNCPLTHVNDSSSHLETVVPARRIGRP